MWIRKNKKYEEKNFFNTRQFLLSFLISSPYRGQQKNHIYTDLHFESTLAGRRDRRTRFS